MPEVPEDISSEREARMRPAEIPFAAHVSVDLEDEKGRFCQRVNGFMFAFGPTKAGFFLNLSTVRPECLPARVHAEAPSEAEGAMRLCRTTYPASQKHERSTTADAPVAARIPSDGNSHSQKDGKIGSLISDASVESGLAFDRTVWAKRRNAMAWKEMLKIAKQANAAYGGGGDFSQVGFSDDYGGVNTSDMRMMDKLSEISQKLDRAIELLSALSLTQPTGKP